jgi:hypothetical protein
MLLVTFTPMAWEIDHRDFTNRVNYNAVCTRTYSTERAIARYKLYHFAGKEFTAFVGPPDDFRYFPEPVLSSQSGG